MFVSKVQSSLVHFSPVVTPIIELWASTDKVLQQAGKLNGGNHNN